MRQRCQRAEGEAMAKVRSARGVARLSSFERGTQLRILERFPIFPFRSFRSVAKTEAIIADCGSGRVCASPLMPMLQFHRKRKAN